MLYEGRIVSVIQRGQNRFVGELCREFARWFVVPEDHEGHVHLVPRHVPGPDRDVEPPLAQGQGGLDQRVNSGIVRSRHLSAFESQ